MRNIRYKRAISALVLLALMSLACNLFNRISSTPVQSTSIPISTEAVDSLREDISTAVDDFGKGEQVTLVIDEAELSSLVAFELQKQSEPIFHEPQIYLQDGQVQVSGKVQQGGFLVPSQMSLVVTVDSTGYPQIKALSAKVGPFNLSEDMLNEISGQINILFTNSFRPRLSNIYVESITIADGMMTIIGHNR